MGDSCCSPRSIGAVANYIQEVLGVHVHSIATGPTESQDVLSTYFGSVNAQVEQVCQQLREVPELAWGYNAIGFSQGGQFMRAVAQRCGGSPRMHTLITMGAQHQGIMNMPSCGSALGNGTAGPGGAKDNSLCSLMRRFIGQGVWLPYVRDDVVQAQYFKDPARMDEYLSYNRFLAALNNEHEEKNASYAAALGSLERFVMFLWEQDEMVVPKESGWFGVWDPEQNRVLDLEETRLYKEDWIGLRALHEDGRLERRRLDGGHMHLALEWFKEEVLLKYLAGNRTTGVGET